MWFAFTWRVAVCVLFSICNTFLLVLRGHTDKTEQLDSGNFELIATFERAANIFSVAADSYVNDQAMVDYHTQQVERALQQVLVYSLYLVFISITKMSEIHAHVNEELVPMRERAKSKLTDLVGPLEHQLADLTRSADAYTKTMTDLSTLLNTIMKITEHLDTVSNLHASAKVFPVVYTGNYNVS